MSEGVVVGEYSVYSHGHFSEFRTRTNLGETMTFYDERGNLIANESVIDIQVPYSDKTSTLFILPNKVNSTKPVELGDPTRLQPGSFVTVLYWNDANSQFAAMPTIITSIDKTTGQLAVADPHLSINEGDSGSPVFNSQMELIGNIRSISWMRTGDRNPWFYVDPLPHGISDLVR